jgi:FkbM family methyltransferase
MRVYFDIGSNNGSSSINWANEGHEVHMFEPNPELTKNYAVRDNVHINQVAVSDYDGKAKFNICVTHDLGCSSLLDVSDRGRTEWGGRRDMIPATQLEVKVIRLDSYEPLNHIDEIEYFHCDAQGSDLKVLQGMGVHLRKIKAGIVEAAAKQDILYKGQNYIQETIAFLESNGFAIQYIQANDVQHNEVNISFIRVENNLGESNI